MGPAHALISVLLEKEFAPSSSDYTVPTLAAAAVPAAYSAFEKEHVISFVESIRKGLERVQTLQGGKLGAVETIQPWDGLDGKVEEVEEFSLDDIMNEEL